MPAAVSTDPCNGIWHYFVKFIPESWQVLAHALEPGTETNPCRFVSQVIEHHQLDISDVVRLLRFTKRFDESLQVHCPNVRDLDGRVHLLY